MAITDSDPYLIGLSYPSGTLWIAAPDNHCLDYSNGHFTTSTHVATSAIVAYQGGSWVNLAVETNPPGPARPITSAQDAVSRALSVTAEIVSATRSRATLTTIAAMISTGYVRRRDSWPASRCGPWAYKESSNLHLRAGTPTTGRYFSTIPRPDPQIVACTGA